MTTRAAAGDETQRRARALGDPTRFNLFDTIAASELPVTIAALCERFGLNHTTVRQHLALLVDAGLVVEAVAPPTGPGRPHFEYTVAPGVEGTWLSDGPYEQLAAMLLEALTTNRPVREIGVEHGKRAAASLTSKGDPLEAMEAGVAAEGFEPSRTGEGARVVLTLGRCPFANVAADDPATVCQLHRGLAEGLAAGIGDLEVVALRPRPPHRAGCRLVVRQVQEETG